MGILGKALAGAAGAVQPVAMEGLRASIMAERDARMQQYSTSERIAGQEFQAVQAEKTKQHQTESQKAGFEHTEKLADTAAARAENLQQRLLESNSKKEQISLLSDSMKTAQKELSETMAALESNPENKVLMARQSSLMSELNSYRSLANRLITGGKADGQNKSFKDLWGTEMPEGKPAASPSPPAPEPKKDQATLTREALAKHSTPEQKAKMERVKAERASAKEAPAKPSGLIQDQFLPESQGGEGIPGLARKAAENIGRSAEIVSKAIRPADAYVQTDIGKKQLKPGETLRIENKDYRVGAPDKKGVWTLIDLASGKAIRIRTTGEK